MVKYGFGFAALALMGVFFANMLVANFMDATFLGRVQAFLTLAAACAFFVIMVLMFEREAGASTGPNERP